MQRNIELGRRGFLLRSTGIAAAALAGSALARLTAARAEETGFKTSLKKALIANKPSRDYLEKLKAAGFDGVEAYPAAQAEAEARRKDAEDLGLRIHSVLRG
ncbi:MAG: hypothetical protein JXA90_13775, partial [Planctomycetes bacterium]|nr:hypothetical protein [Planctomycetota bacterium]